ncbi:hypothetical protein HGRIS_006864 [Hohenbuehelia grisea]|uniref:F-box domain-containing protein n=1 Tax=Hohenbuehelia grisea TaxID=104357 RepID=A0ABR3JAP3_9AGAR
MPSTLDTIPCDVLELIAYFTTSPFESLIPIRQLLLTSTTVHRHLCLDNCPSLYASIYHDQFDLDAPRRRLGSTSLTDSALAAELLQRHHVLLRIRRKDWTSLGLEQDMWTAYFMILENDSLNAAHLERAGFSEFLLGLARAQFRVGTPCEALSPVNDTVRSLVLWSYCLTVPRRNITSLRGEVADELLTLVRPYAVSAPKASSINPHPLSSHLSTSSSNQRTPSSLIHVASAKSFDHDARRVIRYYSRSWTVKCPDIASAAIILTFALKELTPLAVPPHLPLDRATAIANGRTGPTMEDFRLLASRRTPLLIDNSAGDLGPPAVQGCLKASPSVANDLDFNRMILASPDGIYKSTRSYNPGTLSGTWEGTFWNAPVIPSTDIAAGGFMACQAFECQISEYLCFSPNIPLPTVGPQRASASVGWDYKPSQLIQSKDGFNWGSNTFRYEKLDRAPRSPEDAKRDTRQALDVIIAGEVSVGLGRSFLVVSRLLDRRRLRSRRTHGVHTASQAKCAWMTDLLPYGGSRNIQKTRPWGAGSSRATSTTERRLLASGGC